MDSLHVRGVLLPDDEVRDLYLLGDRISLTKPPGAVRTVAHGGFVLPGLVDAHCHIGIRNGGVPVESLDEARALATIDRDAGVLALRDAGSPFAYPELDGATDLPRLARAGRHLAPPKRYTRGYAEEVTAADLPAAVRREAARGNGWVKLVGDWIDRDLGDLSATYDPATVRAAIAAAHGAGARVAVHTFAEAAIAPLLEAGVDSVEHGTGLSPELIAVMAAQGTALVPTMINIETFDAIAARADGKFPAYAQHMRQLKAAFPGVVRDAYDAGVPIYVGTDAGGGINHGLAAEEMLMLQSKAGISAVEILAAASWKARTWLGFGGPVTEGSLADLVIYPEDPRINLAITRAPQRIILRGRVVR